MYHIDATFFSRRALREALCCYYGGARRSLEERMRSDRKRSLIVAGKDPSVLFEPSQEKFGRFLGLLHRVAEVGAITVLNVLEDDAKSDDALRAKIAAMEPIAKRSTLPLDRIEGSTTSSRVGSPRNTLQP
jgi:hypothetical protein